MNKKTTFATVVGFVAAMGIMIPAGNVESAPEARELRVTPAQDDPYETLPIIDAYYARVKSCGSSTPTSQTSQWLGV